MNRFSSSSAALQSLMAIFVTIEQQLLPTMRFHLWQMPSISGIFFAARLRAFWDDDSYIVYTGMIIFGWISHAVCRSGMPVGSFFHFWSGGIYMCRKPCSGGFWHHPIWCARVEPGSGSITIRIAAHLLRLINHFVPTYAILVVKLHHEAGLA